jgi:hypothetical protein
MAACADRPLNRTQPGPPGRPTPRAWGPVAVDGLSLSRADFRRAESPSGSDPPAPWTITLVARERAAANATPAPQHPVGDRSRNPSVPRARKGSARAASSPMRGCKPNPSSHGAWRSSPQLHRRRKTASGADQPNQASLSPTLGMMEGLIVLTISISASCSKPHGGSSAACRIGVALDIERRRVPGVPARAVGAIRKIRAVACRRCDFTRHQIDHTLTPDRL